LNGQDASPAIKDPELIGHSYVGPYAVLEPESCFVAVQGHRVAGYIVATPDSANFHRKCETLWFPVLRTRYPAPSPEDQSPSAMFTRTLHRGHLPPVSVDLALYPASLHIDLLPEAQGRGVGRRLMNHLFERLRMSGVPGVHLYVSRSNPGAIAFYQRIGFELVDESQQALGFGLKLN
jgi:ribosomal protein S18 acetylase RimI-like enzyme